MTKTPTATFNPSSHNSDIDILKEQANDPKKDTRTALPDEEAARRRQGFKDGPKV